MLKKNKKKDKWILRNYTVMKDAEKRKKSYESSLKNNFKNSTNKILIRILSNSERTLIALNILTQRIKVGSI